MCIYSSWFQKMTSFETTDYGNHPLKFLGKMVVTLQSNGWLTNATINVIGGCRPSITGRDFMPELGLMLVEAPAEQGMLNIQKHGDIVEQDENHDDWQKHFSNFTIFFTG